MMLFGLLVPILLVILVVYLLGWRPGTGLPVNSLDQRQTPIEVLKARYARGEISRDEFEQMRRDLA